MSGGPVRLEHDGGLAVVTFDSPPVNLYDEALHRALSEAIEGLQGAGPRAVLFRAEGRVVSGGVDVSLFAAQEGPEAAAETFRELVDVARRVDLLPCPTV